MRKTVIGLLILALAAFSVPALADDISDEDLALYGGEWRLTVLTMEGLTYRPAAMGLLATMTLNADGSAAMDMAGDLETGTWRVEEDGIVVDLEVSGPATVEMLDGELVATQEGISMTFSREPTEPAGDDEPFAGGKYSCSEALIGGYAVALPDMGGEYSADFGADGSAVLVLAGARLEDLSWAEEDGAIAVRLPGGRILRFVPVEEGLEMDYSSAARLLFRAE